MASDFMLYGTPGCHLCEEAEALLARQPGIAAWKIELIDIAEDDGLVERFGTRIPVLRAARDGAELDWPFDAAALAAWLPSHGGCNRQRAADEQIAGPG